MSKKKKLTKKEKEALEREKEEAELKEMFTKWSEEEKVTKALKEPSDWVRPEKYPRPARYPKSGLTRIRDGLTPRQQSQYTQYGLTPPTHKIMFEFKIHTRKTIDKYLFISIPTFNPSIIMS